MLTLSKKAWLAATLASLVALVAGIVIAHGLETTRPSGSTTAAESTAQGEDGECPENDPNCYVQDEDNPPPPPGTPGDTGDDGGGDGRCYWNGGGGITVALAQTRIQIPCYLEGVGWYNGNGCYLGETPALVEGGPTEPPEGKTEEDGAWYFARCFFSVRIFNGQPVFTWQADLEWQWVDNADVPVITPLQVAQDWLASVTLNGIEFQLAPPETGAGLVTLPVWLGVDETANSWGPINDEHCLGGVCVTIVAQVSSVEWSMGDGTSFSCERDEHIAWQSGTHDYLRPTGCHHYYQRASRDQPDGKYQINATSTWTVVWTSTDDAGELSTTRDATAALQIDEIQVLTR